MTSSPKYQKQRKTFREAHDLLRDMERLVSDEVELLASGFDFSVPFSPSFHRKCRQRYQKRKRHIGPKLIQPNSKKKSRQVVGEMVFDPVQNIWLGNEAILQDFESPRRPTLLPNTHHPQQAIDVGDMRYDPHLGKWTGNEEALELFSFQKPALIKDMSGKAHERKRIGEMEFDPLTMKWTGNEDLLDDFKDLSDFPEESKSNRREFIVEGELAHSLLHSENIHRVALSGWNNVRNIEKSRLLDVHFLNDFSLSRIIRDAKLSRLGALSESDRESITSEDELLYTAKTPVVVDESDDWDDVDITENSLGPLKLKAALGHPETMDDVDDEEWILSDEDKDNELEAQSKPTTTTTTTTTTTKLQTFTSDDMPGLLLLQQQKTTQPKPLEEVDTWDDDDFDFQCDADSTDASSQPPTVTTDIPTFTIDDVDDDDGLDFGDDQPLQLSLRPELSSKLSSSALLSAKAVQKRPTSVDTNFSDGLEIGPDFAQKISNLKGQEPPTTSLSSHEEWDKDIEFPDDMNLQFKK